jgi:hypothetical protein
MQLNAELAQKPIADAGPSIEKCNVRRKPPRDWLHEREVEALIAAVSGNPRNYFEILAADD